MATARTVDDRARGKELRSQIATLKERLEGVSPQEKKALRWEIATLQEELADCTSRLRANRPKVQRGTTWAGMGDFKWSQLQHKTWLEVEQMGDVEGTTRGAMVSAFRDALACRGVLTDAQRQCLELALAGSKVTAIAQATGKDKSTVSRTLKRARERLEREATRLYSGRQLVGETFEDGVLHLEDIDQGILAELLRVSPEWKHQKEEYLSRRGTISG